MFLSPKIFRISLIPVAILQVSRLCDVFKHKSTPVHFRGRMELQSDVPVTEADEMANVTIKYNEEVTASDPHKNAVLIVGQQKHLSELPYSHIKLKLEPRVSEELFKNAIEHLRPPHTESCPLYMNMANIALLPKNCSRHNASSRPHAITKIVKNLSSGGDEFVVIVCEQKDVFASACAVARAFPLFSKKSKGHSSSRTISVEFLIVNGNGEFSTKVSPSDVTCMTTAAEGIRLAAKIVDAPCNEMSTNEFIQEVIKIGINIGITPYIVKGEELKEAGFGGIYNVGKAAINPPALVVLSYFSGSAKDTIALVGKGIMYDTGGLSIKSRTAMTGMKRDCGGAAAILAAFYVAVKLGFKENLHAVLCLAENAVGPEAMRPDDIITMYSGRTVEVNNTDAEGRLVLGDGVAYAEKDLNANIIIDMATLTGAQGISTGKYHAAVITNHEGWEHAIIKAGQSSGDLVHPLPYCPELHFSEFGSAFADMKNSVADRSNAQSSCAALFVGAHIGFDNSEAWIHIDMASPSHCGERATGYGVALLATLLGQASKNPMLSSIAPSRPENGPEVENASKKIRLA